MARFRVVELACRQRECDNVQKVVMPWKHPPKCRACRRPMLRPVDARKSR